MVSDCFGIPKRLPAGAPPGSIPGGRREQQLRPLYAAFGQDEANHGTECYSVGADGLVWVPLAAAGPLICTGGFAAMPTTDQSISSGMIDLQHRDAIACSYRGRQYTTDEKGNLRVPAEAAAELAAHGFVPIEGRSALPSNGKRLTGSLAEKDRSSGLR